MPDDDPSPSSAPDSHSDSGFGPGAGPPAGGGRRSDGSDLAALVPKPASEAVAARFRADGIYDGARSVREYDAERVAVPVTDPPSGYEVVVQADPAYRGADLPALLRQRGFSAAEIDRAPGSWAVVGSVVLAAFGDCERRAEVGEALLDLHGEADTVLARGGIDGPHREPDVAVVAGAGDTETVHTEHGTRYALDLAEVMFSPGNKAERVRMGEVVAADERVLDPFAGIGYFALPMARAGARVTAIERNPTAFRYLLENARLNGVGDRLAPVRGDCREVLAARPDGQADRAVLGYYDAPAYLDAALPALAPGGVLHLHAAVPDARYPDRPVDRLEAAAADVGRGIEVLDVWTVKTHSEGVRHAVVDARID
jgi:tRNA wybutosine-synthesizing protein 2